MYGRAYTGTEKALHAGQQEQWYEAGAGFGPFALAQWHTLS